ncbi:MAG: hypothetical protein J7M27_11485, partial [Candidatus Latescibacteria bacterium]|nr:hypothetical protein [Candidatus Latescibacterota bacterium]
MQELGRTDIPVCSALCSSKVRQECLTYYLTWIIHKSRVKPQHQALLKNSVLKPEIHNALLNNNKREFSPNS